jgi:enoyl-CoA hydratase
VTPPEPGLRVEIGAGVASLVFDRPERHNALTIGMSNAIVAALNRSAEDEDIRIVTLRGSGGSAFMSGADIDEQGAHPDAFRRAAHGMLAALAAFEKPLLAVIDGYCLGGGLSVALQADIRVAGATATFGVPAARLGIGYPWNSVGPLVSLVGVGPAADLLFTGRRIDADEAARLGIVQRVHPVEELTEAARAVAEQIAANAPLSVRAAKAAVALARPKPTTDELSGLVAILARCEASADYQEGQAAFRERRPPEFRGR